MRILCFTDSLGSGGAQRQLTLLAILLKERGHIVLFATYNPGEHFSSELASAGISREKLDGWPKWMRPLALRLLINKFQPDGVIAFQEAPALYAEIASFGIKRCKLIVSERNARPSNQTGFIALQIRQFHRFAHVVTTNSFTNSNQIEKTTPSLRGKVVTIYNAVDIHRFCPSRTRINIDSLQMVVLSSHKLQKNFEVLAHATRLLMTDSSIPAFTIEWFGDEAPGWLTRDRACCEWYGVSSIIYFNSPTKAPEAVLDEADALILPSLWEGLPNSVCEALSAGCPVLMSDVSDARVLIQEGVTGYLFDPKSPKSLAHAIRKFLLLSIEQRNSMRIMARKFAERTFSPERYVLQYETLLEKGSKLFERTLHRKVRNSSITRFMGKGDL